MNPDMSRLDRTMPVAATPEESETPGANVTTAGQEDGAAGEGEEGQAVEGEEG